MIITTSRVLKINTRSINQYQRGNKTFLELLGSMLIETHCEPPGGAHRSQEVDYFR